MIHQQSKLLEVRDNGFIHMWHDKDCDMDVKDTKQMKACLGSKAALSGYDLGMKIIDKNTFRNKYISPNEILKDTVVLIKTYNRPECLTAFLDSLEEYAPWLPVIVADDSDDSNEELLSKYNLLEYVRLPSDTGVGYGRNQLVQKASFHGFKYIIMSDENYILPNMELIPNMAKAMIDNNANAVAPLRCELEADNSGISTCARGEIASIIEIDNGIMILPNLTNYNDNPLYNDDINDNELDCQRSDLIQQFFIADTESLLKSGWDDHLKNNDHYDAMLNMKKNNMKLFICSKINILHSSIELSSKKQIKKKNDKINDNNLYDEINEEEIDELYDKLRSKAWISYMPYVLKKWNITFLHDQDGRKWNMTADNKIQTQCGINCSDLPAIDYKITNDEFIKIQQELNRHRPSWDAIKLDKNHYHVKKVTINSCMDRINFKSSEVSWKNRNDSKKFHLEYSLFLLKACPALYNYMKIISAKSYVLPDKLYYVIGISDENYLSSQFLDRLFNQITDNFHIEIIIVCMGNFSHETEFRIKRC